MVRRLREEEVVSVRNKIGLVSLWFFLLIALQVFAFPKIGRASCRERVLCVV